MKSSDIIFQTSLERIASIRTRKRFTPHTPHTCHTWEERNTEGT